MHAWRPSPSDGIIFMVTVVTGEPQMRGHIVVVDQTQPNINICVNDDATQSKSFL